MYAKLFRRWEQDYGADIVRHMLIFIAISLDGLLEQDLMWLTEQGGGPFSSTRLSPFLYSAELEISPRPGVLALTNAPIARAIQQVYLTPEAVIRARESLISYFQKPSQTEFAFLIQVGDETLRKKVTEMVANTEGKMNALQGRAFNELPWQLFHAGRWDELSELVSRADFLHWAEERRPRDPARWWRALSAKGYHPAAAFAEELAPNESVSLKDLERIVSLLGEIGEKEQAFRGRDLLNEKYRVEQVRVEIADGAGTVLETGQAALAVSQRWEYPLRQAHAGSVSVTVFARDLPGHVTRARVDKKLPG